MRTDLDTPTRARRRATGLALALLATAGLTLVGCSDHSEPDTPAISGEDPGEVTVPTLPPTTTTVPTVSTLATTTTAGG